MFRFRHFHAFVIVALALILAAPIFAAQAQSGSATVVASGFANIRGFTWGPDGALYAGLAGTSSGPPPVVAGTPAAFAGGTEGSIVKIANGCVTTVAKGLPSATLTSFGWQFGVMDLAFLDGQLYALDTAGGAAHNNPTQPGGIYKIGSDGAPTIVADLVTWVNTNPPSTLPPEGFPNGGSLFSMIVVAGNFWVSDAVNGQVLKVTPAGAISRVADISKGHFVPSGLAPAPDGGAFLGFETSAPYPTGESKVVHIAADGAVTDVWTGLTDVTGIAVGPDGALYAAEMSTNNTTKPPFVHNGAGKIVKQTGPASSAEVATGVDAPVAIHFGKDGALYISGPAFGSTASNGMILRLDVSSGTPIAITGPMTATMAVCASATPGY